MATATKEIVVYRLYDADDTLLYVGITSNWVARQSMHRRDKSWWNEVKRTEFEICASAELASDLEVEQIATLHPRYNKVRTRRALNQLTVPLNCGIHPGIAETLERLCGALHLSRKDVLSVAIYRLACEEGVAGPDGTVGRNPTKELEDRIERLSSMLTEIATIATREEIPE